MSTNNKKRPWWWPPSWMFQFTGDLKFHDKVPYFIYKPSEHKVKGHEIRQILNLLKPGDIMLYKHNKYLNSYLTPGKWAHAAIFVGGNQIIHAIGEGVQSEDVIDFCRCDSVCVLRVKNSTEEQINFAIDSAFELLESRTGYDFEFMSENGSVYCTELVNECYKGLFNDDFNPEVYGVGALLPDGLYMSDKIEKIVEFIHK